jgi:aspartyl-tRNA(Asn)/glutamyl-tRNA(Gln) amidotransferase subunit B
MTWWRTPSKLENGGRVTQQTMGWSEMEERTYVQRSKEYAEDYRYFPEPDLPPLEVSREWVAQLHAQLPELPAARRARFVTRYGLSDYDAGALVGDPSVADYYEATAVAATGVADPKTVANWISGELFRLLKESGQEIDTAQVSPQALAGLIGLVQDGTVNANTGKKVLAEMFASGRSARQIVEERGLAQLSDTAALAEIVARVVEENAQAVNQYMGGKAQVFGWLMGQVMKATRGQANPQVVRTLLLEQLEVSRNA